MAQGKFIRESEYKQLKSLLDAGVRSTKLAKLYDRSYPTINSIRKSTSYRNYQENNRVRSEKVAQKRKSIFARFLNRGEVPTTVSSTPTLDALIRIEKSIKEMREIFEKTVKENL